MKTTLTLISLFAVTHCLSQSAASHESNAQRQQDTSTQSIVFFDDFTDNINHWTVADNKDEISKIDSGFYYVTAPGHAYGEAQEVKIDPQKDFQIEARIKIANGNAGHKNYYSMLFWGREAMNSYYFTFSKDGFASIERCDSKNQNGCTTMKGSLQKTALTPDGFNVYRVTKKGNTYTFFINGAQFYQMPFAPFFGNLMGVGAGRKVSLVIDYIKVVYL